jgi:hypothetical protein
MRVRRPLGSSRPTRPVGQGPVTSGVTTSPRTRSAAGSASDHPFAARNPPPIDTNRAWARPHRRATRRARLLGTALVRLPRRSRARHCVRSRRWGRRPCRARRHRADRSVPGRRPPHGAGERGGGVAREDAISASGGLRAAAARYVRGVAVPPGTVRDTEAARRRTYQRRSSSAPHTTNGKGATKSSSSAESEAVPSSA